MPWLALILVLLAFPAVAGPDAAAIVRAAIEHYRGKTSWMRLEMVIHRPDWERRLRLEAWTQGLDRSLVRVLAPRKDAGNATLLVGDAMWLYNPRVNRVIRIPASMMNQSWMGSDFSNNDIARSDDLIDQYDHRLLGEERVDGHRAWRIRSIPHEDAPVVWGFEDSLIRDDYVFLEHTYYDQAGSLVRRLTAREIEVLDGRPYAVRERMERLDKPGHWTEVHVLEARFDRPLPADLFTLANLRNPRP